MNYRFGFDLGTNSIGWSVYSLDSENHPINLVDMGVRIFSDGRDPKTKEPLAVERRTTRGHRRLIHRRKLRRRAAFRMLLQQGLFPTDKQVGKSLKGLNPYELRVKALDEKLEPYELGRILFNLSVRRGFKSNRKDSSMEEIKENTKSESLSQTQKCQNLATAIAESNYRTLGEFLWKNQDIHKGIRFAPNRMNYYPTRQLYIDEFNAIREKQKEFYPALDWDAIYEVLFFQRPLQPQERGCCQYMVDEKRTFKAMPCAQKIRILQDVYNLTFIANGKSKNLLPEWRDELVELLNSQEKVTFKAMRKKLGLDAGIIFNLESGDREFLQGNVTACKLRNENRFGKVWDSLSLQEQDDIVEILITAEEDSTVYDMLEKYNLSNEQKQAIVRLVLPSGTTSFCRMLTENVIDMMEQEKCQFHIAIEKLGYKYADQTVEKYDFLPYYGKVLVGSTMGIKSHPKNDEEKYGKISNPTVHIALNQVKVVVNALIKEYGKPEQVVIEVSRDLKASREAKKEIQARITANKKRNEVLNKNIKDANPSIPFPNREDRLKFRLWEELNPMDALKRHCIYCGKQIGGADIFNGNAIQVEHILPFSRTLWDSEHNKTVAHTSCNAYKGERSPFEAFGNSPSGYNWQEILERVANLKDVQKKRLFAENAMETFEKDSSFISRQLTDNAYLSKMALKYLKAVSDNVWAVTGGMTKLLRDKWDIDSILKGKITEQEIVNFNLKEEQIGTYKKNRYDHRHHALDACVIALIDRRMVQEISRLNQFHKKNRLEAPPMPVLRTELMERVKNIVVSFKPDHGAQGKLSKETLLGKIKTAKVVSIETLKTEADITLLRNDKVRKDFEEKLAEIGNMKDVVTSLKAVYPFVWVYEELYVSRTAIVSLKEKDVDSIIDKKIKEQLQEFINQHTGEKFEAVLQTFSDSTGIKKVRCKNKDQKPIEITNCDSTKRYLCTEDYLMAIVWEIPSKKEGGKPKYEAIFVRRDQIGSDGKPKNVLAPHPAAKKVCQVYKNDYLEFVDNGIWYKCRVAGYSATSNKFDIRPIYATSDTYDWLLASQSSMTETCWKPQKGQNYISVNVLFGEKQARRITVNPIGRVFRKK